jgi:hypothetical protein
MVLSDGAEPVPGWRNLEEGQVLVVDRDLQTTIHSL